MLTNLKEIRLQKEMTQTGLAKLDNVSVKAGTVNKLTTTLGYKVSQII